MENFWDQRYSEQPAVYGWEPNEFLVSVADQLATPSRIVCLGEGYGRNALWLAKRGHKVTIVDSSQVAIELAKRKALEWDLQVETVCEDLASYSPPPCDAVVAIYLHLPPELRQVVHARAWQALRPQGRFIMECFRKEQIRNDSGGPRDVKMLYSVEELQSDFPEAEFEILAEATIQISEGKYHAGEAEVLRILARKKV